MRSFGSTRSLIGAVLAAVFLLAGCVGTPGVRDPQSFTPTEVGSLAHLSFPEGTVLVSTTFQAFEDWHLTAILTFPADAVDQFATDNALVMSDEERPVRDDARPDDPTWTPDASTNVLSYDGSADPISGVYRRLLLDLDDPETVTLYLVAFTT